MSVLTVAQGTSAPRNFGNVDIPFRSQCLAAHLFNTNQTTCITNLVGGQNLLMPGAAPTYFANSVLFGPGSYFQTQFSGVGRNRFVIIVSSTGYQDRCYEVTDTTYRFPPIYGPANCSTQADSPLISWNGGQEYIHDTQFARVGYGGPDINSASIPKLTYAFGPLPIADPDGTWQDYPTPIGLGTGPSTAELYAQYGQVMRSYSIAQSGSAPANSTTTIGNTGSTATSKIRMHSYFEWTYLTSAQAMVALAWAGAQANYDGFRTTCYYPDQPA